jgi:two-component system, cell cycle response regulator
MASPPPSEPVSGDVGEDTEKTAVISGDQETLKKELAKAKEQAACLIIIRGQPQGHRFFLTQPEMIIGRDQSADIVVSDQSISRKHSKLTQDETSVTLTDLGSSNGTFINDVKLEASAARVLEKEDMIKMGNSIFKFLPAGELEILFYGNLGSAAHTDSMTRIYNKGYLLEALEAEFKRAKALHNEFSILFFDLDHFKNINDTYGHDAGDFVLKEFSALVRSSHLRPKDVFARYGGEEFVVLLSATGAKAAAELAERIRAAIETHSFIYEGKRLPITTSLGVAELHAGVTSALTLLKAADKAMYLAKQSGRNRVEIAGT